MTASHTALAAGSLKYDVSMGGNCKLERARTLKSISHLLQRRRPPTFRQSPCKHYHPSHLQKYGI
jgi:hypothetical protein